MPCSPFSLEEIHHGCVTVCVVCSGGLRCLWALSYLAMAAMSLLMSSLHASFAPDCNLMLIPISIISLLWVARNNILGSSNYLCSLWHWPFVWSQGSVCSTSPMYCSSTCSCMWLQHQSRWVSHQHYGNVAYSWHSSAISSSAIPSKSLLSIFAISAGLSLHDIACLSALSNSSGRSWNRSMILHIPLPGWVAEVGFLLATDVRTMLRHPGHQRRRLTVTWLAFLS